MRFKTALIIGGTGMLSEASEFLVVQSEKAILVARHASSFVDKDKAKRVNPLDTDYLDTDNLIQRLTALPEWSTVDVAVLWIHDSGEASLEAILEILREKPCLIVHVLGSSSGNPRLKPDIIENRRNGISKYRTVVLGSIRTSSGRRWLTDQEISQGVIDAITQESDIVVGNV